MAYNNSLKKNEMPLLSKEERIGSFKEVALGYDETSAIEEANRCLNCKNRPCVSACPVGVKIPCFIEKIKEGKFEEAYQIIREDSVLPAVCSRVCPQEKQCEGKCVRAIKGESVAIGRLERFASDYHKEKNDNLEVLEKNSHKVAIIGSGPAGLSCAGILAKLGYDVTIFEALHIAGGVLVYGIPEFRLPKRIVEKEVNDLIKLGVKIETNMVIGKVFLIDELIKKYGFDAVFIGTGAGLPKFMNIPGENLKGVYSANEFLTRINLMKAYENDSFTPIKKSDNVIVVGGGNVAMDAARSAKRLGAKNVYIVYRRGLEELPARKEEIEHAMEEDIIFKLLCNPLEIVGDEEGNVCKIKCIEMELGEKDVSGRRKPVVKENSEFMLDADCVIMALGTSPNPLIKSTTDGLATEKWGGIIVDENGKTNVDGIYAGGDVVSGAATVILAMGAGKKAAYTIDEYIKNK